MEEINKVNNTALAIVLIAVAVMLVGGLGAAATTTGPAATTLQKAFAESQRPDRFAGSDRCVTSQVRSTDTTNIDCFADTDKNVVKENSKEAKESCKDAREQGEVDKCSSSQTGNGELCNWVRIKGDEAAVVVGDGPPCNDERHAQKDQLQK
jgi:hypothetical protein